MERQTSNGKHTSGVPISAIPWYQNFPAELNIPVTRRRLLQQFLARGAAAPQPRNRNRAVDSQLTRSFDRLARRGLRLIKGGKDPADVASEYCSQIAKAAPTAAAHEVTDAAEIVLLIAAVRDPEVIDLLPARGFQILGAMGIDDTFPGEALRSLNSGSVSGFAHCDCPDGPQGKVARSIRDPYGNWQNEPHCKGCGKLLYSVAHRYAAVATELAAGEDAGQTGEYSTISAPPSFAPDHEAQIAEARQLKKAGNGRVRGWDVSNPEVLQIAEAEPAAAPKPPEPGKGKAKGKAKVAAEAEPNASDDQTLETMLRCAANGYSVIPCKGKGPHIKDWQKKRGADEKQIKAWRRDYSDHANVGMHCDLMPCIDVDITLPEACEEMWTEIQDFFGDRGVLMSRDRGGTEARCSLIDAPRNLSREQIDPTRSDLSATERYHMSVCEIAVLYG